MRDLYLVMLASLGRAAKAVYKVSQDFQLAIDNWKSGQRTYFQWQFSYRNTSPATAANAMITGSGSFQFISTARLRTAIKIVGTS